MIKFVEKNGLVCDAIIFHDIHTYRRNAEYQKGLFQNYRE